MSVSVLADTGPLVAIVSPRDQHHEVCIEELRKLSPPLLTCWPVITEAGWLLRHQATAMERLLGSFEAGLLRLVVLDENAVPWIANFLQRYRKIGAQVADAALVYLAEREGIETVFTLDRRDFSIFRLSRNRSLRLLPPL